MLYTVQTDAVVQKLTREGRHCAKLHFIAEKYGDTAEVFLQAYRWYVQRAQELVPKCPESESAIWTFADAAYLEQHPGSTLLALEVPVECAVFFRMSDWNKVLNLRYIGETPQDEQAFSARLEKHGVNYEGDVFTTPFYPQLKAELTKSWTRLFRYDSAVKQEGEILFPDLQAGLWYLDKNWIR